MLLPYLEPIVERLLKLLDPTGDPAHVRRYVQEQAITTLAMVADASETTFGKVGSSASFFRKYQRPDGPLVLPLHHASPHERPA